MTRQESSLIEDGLELVPVVEALSVTTSPPPLDDLTRCILTYAGPPAPLLNAVQRAAAETNQQHDWRRSLIEATWAVFGELNVDRGLRLIQTAIDDAPNDPIIRLGISRYKGCIAFYCMRRKAMFQSIVQGQREAQRLGGAPLPSGIQLRGVLVEARWTGMKYGAARGLEIAKRSHDLVDEQTDPWAAFKWLNEIAWLETRCGEFRAAFDHREHAAELRARAERAGLPEWADITTMSIAAERTYALCKASGDDWSVPVRWWGPLRGIPKMKRSGFQSHVHEFADAVRDDIETLLKAPVMPWDREVLLFNMLHLIAIDGLSLEEAAGLLDRIIATIRTHETGDDLNPALAIFSALKASLLTTVGDLSAVNLIKKAFRVADDPNVEARILGLLAIGLTSSDILPEASLGVAQHAATLRARLTTPSPYVDDDSLWRAVLGILRKAGRKEAEV